jgi:hypothetical protein
VDGGYRRHCRRGRAWERPWGAPDLDGAVTLGASCSPPRTCASPRSAGGAPRTARCRRGAGHTARWSRSASRSTRSPT